VRELPSGTVTFLFTDIEGSTRLLRELGGRYAEALVEHRRVVRAAIAEHGGVEVDTQGDAFFVAFPDAAEALDAASAAQAALGEGPILVRMGLHTGRPDRIDEGYVGEDVHLGARVASAAHGGQVVLTKTAADAARRPLTDLGEHRVKDFTDPVWLFQLGSESFPPLRTISNSNLPRPASSFVGRDREVREVASLLADSARLVTLSGPGGTGKTRLAIEAAAELVGRFSHGVFWTGLATVRDHALVVPAIAQTLGAQGDLATHIGDRDTLLLLDNLEQVLGAAPVLADLIEACPNLRLLVTSRELLRVRGEVEYQVLPLDATDGVTLFCERSGLPACPAIGELCRRLDEMPLALELAAARTKVLSPEQILDRLHERLDLFKGGRDADPRQATLRATIEWSYDLLPADEQGLFARLGVFGGGCTLDAAEAVCGADIDGMQSLVEKSLVRHMDDRFWMLETIRELAEERLAASGEADELRRDLADRLLALGDAAALTAESEGPERPELVRPELDNFRGAIDWAIGHDIELAFRLAVGLEQLWVMNDPHEGVRRLGLLLERGDEVPAELRARALRTHAESTWIAGDFERAGHLMEQSLDEFERIGDERAVAVGLHRLGVAALMADDLSHARELLEASMEMCRSRPNPKLEADIVGKLGWVERREGNRERALELFELSAAQCEQVGFTWMQANAVGDIADMSFELGRTDVAEERGRDAVRLSAEVGDRQLVVFTIGLLARIAAETGQVERAGRLWGAIEAEEGRGPLGQWEHDRAEYATRVLAAVGPDFETARGAGRALLLDEAIDVALSVDSPS
jgi:predicted ATPase